MDSRLTLPLLSGPSPVAIEGGSKTTANENTKKKKKSQGRRKIPIKKIEDKNKKHVTFSKRRKGLFTKASELCILCGADVAIITFSEAGKVFSFGHPSTDAVIHRYLHGSPASSSSPELIIKHENQGTLIGGQSLGREVDDQLGFWWDRNIEGLGLDELEMFAASLGKLKSKVEARLMNLKRQDQDMADLKPNCSSLVWPDPWCGDADNNFHDHQYMQQTSGFQQYGYGCTRAGDDEGIGSIVAMANFNRLS